MKSAPFQFRIRGLLILTLIAALNLCCWRTGSEWIVNASFIFGVAIGAYKARLRYRLTILNAGIGGAFGLAAVSPGELLFVLQQESSLDHYTIFELARYIVLSTIVLTLAGFLAGLALGLTLCPFLFLLHRYMNVIDRFHD